MQCFPVFIFKYICFIAQIEWLSSILIEVINLADFSLSGRLRRGDQ